MCVGLEWVEFAAWGLQSWRALARPLVSTAGSAAGSWRWGHLRFLRWPRYCEGVLVKEKRRRCWNTLFPMRALRPVTVGLRLTWPFVEVRNRRTNTSEITWKEPGTITLMMWSLLRGDIAPRAHPAGWPRSRAGGHWPREKAPPSGSSCVRWLLPSAFLSVLVTSL